MIRMGMAWHAQGGRRRRRIGLRGQARRAPIVHAPTVVQRLSILVSFDLRQCAPALAADTPRWDIGVLQETGSSHNWNASRSTSDLRRCECVDLPDRTLYRISLTVSSMRSSLLRVCPRMRRLRQWPARRVRPCRRYRRHGRSVLLRCSRHGTLELFRHRRRPSPSMCADWSFSELHTHARRAQTYLISMLPSSPGRCTPAPIRSEASKKVNRTRRTAGRRPCGPA